MSQRTASAHADSLPPSTPFEGIDEPLMDQLPTFELFFKTFGFKRIHGRLWGYLVLAGQPLSSREIAEHLSLSSGATSTTINELSEWGAITSEFDSERRCRLHSPVENALSIVATVFRRREQVMLGKFKRTAAQSLEFVHEKYGEKDPRVLSLRSIIASCDIADAVMQLIFTSVERALGDSQSILTRAVNTALRVGLAVPGKLMPGMGQNLTPIEDVTLDEGDEEHEELGALELDPGRTDDDDLEPDTREA